ncbi:MAG: hypothetical protein WC438_04600 [Candidatus Pacearchaeota archaeon]
MIKLCLENIEEERISNPFLRSLVNDLKTGIARGIDPARMTPLSAQLNQYNDGPGHTDHTDYSAHQDTAPPHGDYCD